MSLWKDINIYTDLQINLTKEKNINGISNRYIFVTKKDNKECFEFVLPPMVIINPKIYPHGDMFPTQEDLKGVKYKASFYPHAYKKEDIEKEKQFDGDAFHALKWLKELQEWIINESYNNAEADHGIKQYIMEKIENNHTHIDSNEKEKIMKNEFKSRWKTFVTIDEKKPEESLFSWYRFAYSEFVPSCMYMGDEYNNYEELYEHTKIEFDDKEKNMMKKEGKYKQIIPIYENKKLIPLTLENREKYILKTGDLVSLKVKCRIFMFGNKKDSIEKGIVFEPVWFQVVKRVTSFSIQKKIISIQDIPDWNVDDNSRQDEIIPTKRQRV